LVVFSFFVCFPTFEFEAKVDFVVNARVEFLQNILCVSCSQNKRWPIESFSVGTGRMNSYTVSVDVGKCLFTLTHEQGMSSTTWPGRTMDVVAPHTVCYSKDGFQCDGVLRIQEFPYGKSGQFSTDWGALVSHEDKDFFKPQNNTFVLYHSIGLEIEIRQCKGVDTCRRQGCALFGKFWQVHATVKSTRAARVCPQKGCDGLVYHHACLHMRGYAAIPKSVLGKNIDFDRICFKVVAHNEYCKRTFPKHPLPSSDNQVCVLLHGLTL